MNYSSNLKNNAHNLLNELYQPQNLDSELLDYSDSSSLVDDSPAEHNNSDSNNRTHDTMKESVLHDEEAHPISQK